MKEVFNGPDRNLISRRGAARRGMLCAGYSLLALAAAFHLGAEAGIIAPAKAPRLWLGIAYGWFAALSFAAAQFGLGRLWERIPGFAAAAENKRAAFLYRIAVGLYATTVALTALGLALGVRRAGLIIAIMLLWPLWIGLRELAGIAAGASWPKISAPGRSRYSKILVGLTGLLMAAWILPLFVQSLLPNSDWDGAAYHLPLARQMVAEGIHRAYDHLEAFNYPGGVHLLYAFLLGLGAETAIVPLNFLAALGVLLAAYTLGVSFGGRRAGLWAAALLAGTGLFWEVAVTPRVDVFLTLASATAFLAFFQHQDDPIASRPALICSMALGLALGMKYTAALTAAIVVPCMAVAVWRRNIPGRARIAMALAGLALLALPSWWWYARNAAHFGNPVYPLLTEKTYLDAQGEKRDFAADLNRLTQKMPYQSNVVKVLTPVGVRIPKLGPAVKPPKHLFNLWNILSRPDLYERKPIHGVNPLLFLFLLLPLVRRQKRLLMLYGVGMGIFLLTATQTYILRYVLPVMPLFAVGAGLILDRIRFRPLNIAAAALVCALLVGLSFQEWRKLSQMKPHLYLCAGKTRLTWLTKVGYNGMRSSPRLVRWINRRIKKGEIESDAVIFMVGESKGDLLQCDFRPDNSRIGRPWLEEFLRADQDYRKLYLSMKERRIGYIAVNHGYFLWVLDALGEGRRPVLYTMFHVQNFIERFGKVIFSKDGLVLARLK